MKIGPHIWAARRQEGLGPCHRASPAPSGDSTIRRLSASATGNLQSVKFFSAEKKREPASVNRRL
jgi:hypothetical protein